MMLGFSMSKFPVETKFSGSSTAAQIATFRRETKYSRVSTTAQIATHTRNHLCISTGRDQTSRPGIIEAGATETRSCRFTQPSCPEGKLWREPAIRWVDSPFPHYAEVSRTIARQYDWGTSTKVSPGDPLHKHLSGPSKCVCSPDQDTKTHIQIKIHLNINRK